MVRKFNLVKHMGTRVLGTGDSEMSFEGWINASKT